MSDERPLELVQHLQAQSEKNDVLITDALAKLEVSEQRGQLKPTVASICQLTGLARNTVRSRPWALERLKTIKLAIRRGQTEQLESSSPIKREIDIQEQLRDRIRSLLEQNAVLYEEVLELQRMIAKRDAEITQLNLRKIRRT